MGKVWKSQADKVVEGRMTLTLRMFKKKKKSYGDLFPKPPTYVYVYSYVHIHIKESSWSYPTQGRLRSLETIGCQITLWFIGLEVSLRLPT